MIHRFAIMDFYFEKNYILKITSDAKVNSEAQIALIGGTLGLFTGFSFVSVYEVIYFCYKILKGKHQFKRKSSTKNKMIVPSIVSKPVL